MDAILRDDVLPMECLEVILAKAFVFYFFISYCAERTIFIELASVKKSWQETLIRPKFKRYLHYRMKTYFSKFCQRRTVMRSNRYFLTTNIDPNTDFLQRLLCCDLLTEEEVNAIESLTSLRDKQMELYLKIQSFENEFFLSFIECLRRDKQLMVADVIEHGGVTVKVKLFRSSLHPNAETPQQLVDVLNIVYQRFSTCDKHTLPGEPDTEKQSKENKKMTVYKLDRNDISFLKASPRCSQVFQASTKFEITLWFWCHSRKGLDRLQNTDFLLDLVNSLFKCCESPISHWKNFTEEELLVDSEQFLKTCVTCPVGVCQQTKLHIMRGNKARVLSVTKLKDTILVLIDYQDYFSMCVYEDKLFSYEVPIESAGEPKCIAACQKLQCIFLHCSMELSTTKYDERWCFLIHTSMNNPVFDYWFDETYDLQFTQSPSVHLNLISFSLSENGHIILLKSDDHMKASQECQLNIYKCLGSLNPPSHRCSIYFKVKDPHYAVETPRRTFVISYGYQGESGILELSAYGDEIRRLSNLNPRDQSQPISEPVYLAWGSHDRLLVANKRNGCVVVVDSKFNIYDTIVQSYTHGIHCPTQLYYCRNSKELLILHGNCKNIDVLCLKDTTL